MDNTLLTVFIVVTALAVLLQAGILVAMFFAMRKTSAKVESLAEEVKTKVLPAAELAQSMMIELRPKIVTLVDNVSVSTTVLRTQMERVDATLTDIIDRTRLQVIRADEFVNHTMDKLEETREAVTRTVVSAPHLRTHAWSHRRPRGILCPQARPRDCQRSARRNVHLSTPQATRRFYS